MQLRSEIDLSTGSKPITKAGNYHESTGIRSDIATAFFSNGKLF
jgi:hypothetical protein